jgi:hypothetical protein
VSGISRTLIDSEAVVLLDDGRSDGRLMTKRIGAQALLLAFDFPRFEGDDLGERPLETVESPTRLL